MLNYIVHEALEGRGGSISAQTIQQDVFGCPTTDETSNVRVQAGRLRSLLDRYYQTAGEADPVMIDIPKGTYTPSFAKRQGYAPSASASPQRVEKVRRKLEDHVFFVVGFLLTTKLGLIVAVLLLLQEV
jgi:hypothetical protein